VNPRFGPYGQIEILKAEVNRLINLLLDKPGNTTPSWQPPVDVIDRPHEIIVQVEVPGLVAADLEVSFEGQELIISGSKRRLANEPRPERFYLMERFIGSFRINVELARPVDPSRGQARLDGGILTVILPALDDRRNQPFKIPVLEETKKDE